MRHARALIALAVASVFAGALVTPSTDVVTMLFPAALLFLLASGCYMLGYGQGLKDGRTRPSGSANAALTRSAADEGSLEADHQE
jgi:hypothetical protein